MSLEITTDQINKINIIRLQGKLVLTTVQKASIECAPIVEDSSVIGILLDFNRTTFIDSTGIALIISYFKKTNSAHKSYGLFGLNEENREIFSLSRLDQVLKIYFTQEEALAHMGREAH